MEGVEETGNEEWVGFGRLRWVDLGSFGSGYGAILSASVAGVEAEETCVGGRGETPAGGWLRVQISTLGCSVFLWSEGRRS